jgi:hypothetical protein
MKKCLLILLLSAVWFSPIAHTQPLTDLYEAQVTLKNRSEVVRRDGFKQALTHVLIKLSGDRKRPLQTAIQNELKQIDPLVSEYKYLTAPAETQQVLSVHFDEGAVNDLLARLQLPLWNKNRPTLLWWVMLDIKDQQTVITEDQTTEADLLEEQAKQRGLPLLFPLMDLDDLTTLTTTEVINGSKEPVRKIAKRYGVKHVLVGWLLKTLNGWQGQWRLYVAEEEIAFNSNQPQLEEALTESINRAIDEIAKRLVAIMPVNPVNPINPINPVNPKSPLVGTDTVEEFEVLVTGVPTLRDYAKVSDYLKSLAVIEDLQVLRIQPGEVKFRVTVKGGKAVLRQTLSLGTLLVPRTNKADETGYRYMKP